MSEAMSEEIYGTFAGNVDQANVQRIFTGMSAAMANGVKTVHLLFHSSGGFVGDGVALYNYFCSLPIDLTLYNAGNVASIATVAFLGAKKRKVSAHATFMIHRTMRQELTTAARLKVAAEALLIDDTRTEAILRAHITLSDERWKELDYHDVVFSADEAVDVGLADDIAEFSPPPGTQVYNI